jgi:hypothetical protein
MTISKTPAEIEIEKLEKGCGKEFVDLSLQLRKICGKENTWLCPDCYAKLSGLKQGIELTEKKYSNQKKEELRFLKSLHKDMKFNRGENYSKEDADFCAIRNRIKQIEGEMGQ